jgi:hypothetical protein
MGGSLKLADPRRWVRMSLVAVLSLLCVWARAAGSDPLSADEYSIKAAFIFNLAKFVDWPSTKFENDNSPLILGIAGDGALDKVAAIVKSKSVGSHGLLVRAVNSPEEAKACHILFVTRSVKGAQPLIKASEGSSVLVVGEVDNFLEEGGMIRFYLEANSIRLEINPDAIKRGGVTIQGTALSALINKGIARIKKV